MVCALYLHPIHLKAEPQPLPVVQRVLFLIEAYVDLYSKVSLTGSVIAHTTVMVVVVFAMQ